MSRLQALAHQRRQEGVDLHPAMELAAGIQPLIEQQKFTEAEALVDRTFQLLNATPAIEPKPDAGSRVEPPANVEDAKPLPCPAPGAAIELSSATWTLKTDCSIAALTLRGNAQLWVTGPSLTVHGNIKLEGDAGLHLEHGSFTIANQFKFQYHIEATGQSLLDIRNAKVSTNAGVDANLTSNYDGFGDSRLHIENVEIDPFRSWLLCNLHGRARVETKNSPAFPSEIYPRDSSTVRIEGRRSHSAVWLQFLPGSTAALDNLPASKPFTYSFGRNTPGTKDIGYQVDVVDGNAGFGIESFPQSDVTVRNSHVQLGYEFSNVASPEMLTGLKPGPQSVTLRNQGRVLNLQNAELPPYGWQLYSSNNDLPPGKHAPVMVSDSLINEMGASNQGWFEAEHVQFAFAGIAAVGPGSRVSIRDSVINSHTIMGNSDGVVRIEDSEIYGSRVQAIGRSRILLLNTALKINERNPKCAPLVPSLDGGPPTRCNPYNPAREVQFIANGEGAIWVANIAPMAAIPAGTTFNIVGDAIFTASGANGAPYTYNLRFRRSSASTFTPIVTGAPGPKRGQSLGALNTTNLTPGEYIAELELNATGHDAVTVRRTFSVR